MTILSEYIDFLKKQNPTIVVKNGLGNPHSWRGSYDQLSFEPIENITIELMLKHAMSAVDGSFEGYKGGTYTMTLNTPINIDYEGECSFPNNSVGDYLIELAQFLEDEWVNSPFDFDKAKKVSEVPKLVELQNKLKQLDNVTDWIDNSTDEEFLKNMPDGILKDKFIESIKRKSTMQVAYDNGPDLDFLSHLDILSHIPEEYRDRVKKLSLEFPLPGDTPRVFTIGDKIKFVPKTEYDQDIIDRFSKKEGYIVSFMPSLDGKDWVVEFLSKEESAQLSRWQKCEHSTFIRACDMFLI